MRELITVNTIYRTTVGINDLIDDTLGLLADDYRQFSIQDTLDLADSLSYISVGEV